MKVDYLLLCHQFDAFFIRFVVSKIAWSSNLESLVEFSPGDYFGENALLRNEPRNATIKANSQAWRAVWLLKVTVMLAASNMRNMSMIMTKKLMMMMMMMMMMNRDDDDDDDDDDDESWWWWCWCWCWW